MAAEQGHDFVIVGAGSAGCVLANRLSADPSARVALIEAGGEPTDPAIHDPLAWPSLPGSAVDWAFTTTPQPGTAGRAHAWPRGRAVGGSTCINAMAHVRGHPDDFEAWAAAGCTGWGFADLMPYALKSEHGPHGPSPWHGRGGPLHLIQPADPHPITAAYMAAAEERGLAPIRDHNGPVMAGPTLNTLTIRGGRRQTAADAYLDPAVRARPNLAIMPGRTALRLRFSPAGRCTGAVLAAGAGEAAELVIRADSAVILAGGAIGSPVLLLRSGIGPPEELRALGIACRQPLAGVGRNLHDHLLAGGNVYRSRRPVPPSRYQHSESLTYIAGDAGADAAPTLVVACVVAPIVTETFAVPAPSTAYTLMFGFTHPLSRGTVRLASADPRTAPLIDPRYLEHPRDRRHHLQALDWARAIGGAPALADWRAAEVLPTTADLASDATRLAFVARAAYTHHHPVGTCRMGRDADAVVGPDLAVRGVEGLYVADASVIPAITTGPVNAAVVALAERASDLIAGRSPLPPSDPRAREAVPQMKPA